MLKSYGNLDFRPVGLDAVGRLTRPDVREIISKAPKRMRLQDANIDFALGRFQPHRFYGAIIVVRNRELPTMNPDRRPDDIAGVLLGHTAEKSDIRGLARTKLTRVSEYIAPRFLERVRSGAPFTVIDEIIADPGYNPAIVWAMLLRKYQETARGRRLTVLLMAREGRNGSVATQISKFGYRPFGVATYGTFRRTSTTKNPGLDDVCLVYFAIRTKDVREEGRRNAKA